MVSKEDVLELVMEVHQNQDDFNGGDLEERIMQCDYYELTIVCPQFIEVEFSIDEYDVAKYIQRSLENANTCLPIVLIQRGDSDYELIDGSHRIEAFKALGITKIPAYVGKYLK